MGGLLGMDVEAVRQIAHQLDQQCVQLRGLAQSIDTIVNELQAAWKGSDATRFDGWWLQEHRPALLSCIGSIEGLAQSARNNADEQHAASGGSSNGGSHAVPASPGLIPGQPTIGSGAEITGHRDWREVQAGYDAWAAGRHFAEESYRYQCTSWANYRWHELGYEGSPIRGDGWQMAQNAGPVSSQASLHAIASYGDGSRANHVMIVEEVRADGTIRVSEMNTGSDGSGWQVGNPQEYSDTREIRPDDNGKYYVRGHEIRFAAFPGR